MSDTEVLDPNRWRALYACLINNFMTLLDITIAIIALPSIGTSLHASSTQLQWIVAAYILGFSLTPIIGGRLGDDRGRKQMLLIGTSGFIVTSAIAGLAPNPAVLIAARFVQGLAGGVLNPQTSGVIQNLFPRHERARAFSMIGALVGIAGAAGPVFGGVIIFLGGTDYGWRITFLINVPVGLIGLIMTARWLPSIPPKSVVRRLDLPGVGLLALAIVAVLIPAVEFQASRDLRLILLLIPAAALWALFFWWEAGPARRLGYPLIDVSLFRLRSFADGFTLATLYFGALVGLPFALTLLLQDGLGLSALAAASVASASALTVTVSSLTSGRLMPRYGGKVLVVALIVLVTGITVLALVAFLAVGHVAPATAAALLIVPLAIAGIGQGSVSSPNQVLTLMDVDAAQGSTAGGLLQTGQRVAMAIGSAVGTSVFYAVALHGGPVSGAARQVRYGHAYVAAILLVLVLAVLCLLVAIRSVRRARPPAELPVNVK